MPRSVMKRIRMSPERAQRLARLARETGRTESDLLREGMDLVEQRQRRRIAVEELIQLAQGPEPDKVRFRLKP